MIKHTVPSVVSQFAAASAGSRSVVQAENLSRGEASESSYPLENDGVQLLLGGNG